MVMLAFLVMTIMVVVKHSVDGSSRLRILPVKAGRVLIVVLVEMEISNYSSPA